jgi:hypothetical protein
MDDLDAGDDAVSALLDNPEFIRGIRRMRVWEGRWNMPIVLAVLAAAGGLITLLVAWIDPPSLRPWGEMLWMISLTLYVLVPLLIPLMVVRTRLLDQTTDSDANLAVTPLTDFQIDAGRIWALLLPIAVGTGIGFALAGLSVNWGTLPAAWAGITIIVLWLLLFSQIHFTLLFTLAMGRDRSGDGWTVVVGVAFLAWALDLCFVGLLLKPLFCVMHLVDSLSHS